MESKREEVKARLYLALTTSHCLLMAVGSMFIEQAFLKGLVLFYAGLLVPQVLFLLVGDRLDPQKHLRVARWVVSAIRLEMITGLLLVPLLFTGDYAPALVGLVSLLVWGVRMELLR